MQILNIKAVIVGIPSYQGLLLLSRNMHLNSKGGVIVFLSIYLLYNRVTQYVGARENFVLFCFTTAIRILLRNLSSGLGFIEYRRNITYFFNFNSPCFCIGPLDSYGFRVHGMFDITDIKNTINVGNAGITDRSDNRHQAVIIHFKIACAGFKNRLVLLRSFTGDNIIQHTIRERTPRGEIMRFLESAQRFFRSKRFQSVQANFT